MERRLLIAFILSFALLSAWSAIFPAPKTNEMSKTSQINEIKEDMAIQPSVVQFLPSKSEETLSVNVQKEIKILENSKIRAEFSNLGGNLTKLFDKEHDATLPATNIFGTAQYNDQMFEVAELTAESITYVHQGKGGSVAKKYIFSNDDYTLQAQVEFQGTPDNTDLEAFELDIGALDKTKINASDNSLFEYFIISEPVYRKEGAFKFSPNEAKNLSQNIELVGFRDRYFCIIMRPDFMTDSVRINPADEDTLEIKIRPKTEAGNMAFATTIYFGPQKLGLLKKYKLGFEKAMVFSNWGWLDALAKGIYSLMHWLYKVVPNWGVCIILISFIIYGAMYPLTLYGMSSMKRMQTIQPIMNRLREQYKNNPQRLNKEIMELYKEHRVNPLSGCLPLFMQMPVFVALYQVLWRSVDFKGAHFFWIKDLSHPDRLFILPFSLPMLGNEFNLLPFLMMGIMVVQQKLSAKNMVITDPSQAAQQKMMTMIFPVVLGVIFYKFASGLSLYFTTFYLMSTLTQWKMSKIRVPAK